MLLPFSLKIVWFCLSLSGLLGCWVAMLAFGRALRAYELPLLYCVGCTLLEGSFCIGMLWKMDPFQMPRAFCTAQVTFIGFGTFVITGAAASISIGTSFIVLKPKPRANREKSAIAWRHRYFLLVLVFPLVALSVQLAVMFFYSHWPVQRAEDFNCDFAGGLIWIRFVSYAGTPLLLSIPCFCLSVKSIIHLIKVNRCLHHSGTDIDTRLPSRQAKHLYSIHLTWAPKSSNLDKLEWRVSPNLPVFAVPAAEVKSISISTDPDRLSPAENWQDMTDDVHSLGPNTPAMDNAHRCPEDDKLDDFEFEKPAEGVSSATKQIAQLTQILELNAQRKHQSLARAIWRLILFQFAFTTVHMLSCITSLIAVITRRPPTPFGTQHIALILAGWGPVIVFSHLPAVQKILLPWKWGKNSPT